jgi:NitT/TauT family transport system substrate-binding protein
VIPGFREPLPRGRFFARTAAGITAAAVFTRTRASGQTAPKLTPVRIAVAPSDGVTNVIYAKFAGLFEKAGLDVQFTISQNGAAVAAAVASGASDMGNSSVTSIFAAHERGLPFVFIAPAGIHDSRAPYTGALVLKDSPLTMGKDIENQVVGTVSLGGSGHDAICAWCEQHGGDPTSIKFIEVPFSVTATALEQHRVVAGETVTPSMTVALETGQFRFVPVNNAIAPIFLQSVWFTTKDYSAKNPDVVRTFARVVLATSAYVNGHHADTAPITAQFTGIPLAVVQRMPRATEGVSLSPELIQPAIAANAKYGSLKKAFPAQELIDPLVLNLK